MDEFLWCEKYRPKRVRDTVLPDKLKATFQAVVDGGEVPNMLFTGTAGLGKTTVARAICLELGLEHILINCSEDRNIDVLRNKIRQFASTVSLGGGYKVVILDEFDYANASSLQPALRGFIEEFSRNCRFILTCNFKNRVIEPLHSRCGVYEFNSTRKETAALSAQFMKRAEEILKIENVPYDKKTVADVIMRYTPDWRRILNELQRSAVTGEVSEATVVSAPTKFKELFEHLKVKDFKKIRTWVVNNIDIESSAIFRGIYDEMLSGGHVKTSSIPQLILILADYQHKASFVADQEINTVAAMIEIMSSVEMEKK